MIHFFSPPGTYSNMYNRPKVIEEPQKVKNKDWILFLQMLKNIAMHARSSWLLSGFGSSGRSEKRLVVSPLKTLRPESESDLQNSEKLLNLFHFNPVVVVSNVTYESIHLLLLILFRVVGGAGAYPSCLALRQLG